MDILRWTLSLERKVGWPGMLVVKGAVRRQDWWRCVRGRKVKGSCFNVYDERRRYRMFYGD